MPPTTLGHLLNPAPNILMVDDDAGDLRLTREAIGRSASLDSLFFVHDGQDALDFLRGEGNFEGYPRPDVVILDVNMPRMSGMECLKEIRANPDWNDVVVVMLTTSASPRDRKTARDLGANRFLTKPRDLDEYLELVGSVGEAFAEAQEKTLGE